MHAHIYLKKSTDVCCLFPAGNKMDMLVMCSFHQGMNFTGVIARLHLEHGPLVDSEYVKYSSKNSCLVLC